MSTDEYIAKLDCFKEVLEQNTALLFGVRGVMAAQSKRIFTDGIASDGGKIGSYDIEHPIYVNPKNSPKSFRPQGKKKSDNKSTLVQRRMVKKDGSIKIVGSRVAIKKDFTERKTKYFPNYKNFRFTIGRNTMFVDLNLFGNLKSNFENASRGEPKPRKISNNEYHVVLDSENSLKREGHEDKYGKIFGLLPEELTLLNNIIVTEINRSFKQC